LGSYSPFVRATILAPEILNIVEVNAGHVARHGALLASFERAVTCVAQTRPTSTLRFSVVHQQRVNESCVAIAPPPTGLCLSEDGLHVRALAVQHAIMMWDWSLTYCPQATPEKKRLLTLHCVCSAALDTAQRPLTARCTPPALQATTTTRITAAGGGGVSVPVFLLTDTTASKHLSPGCLCNFPASTCTCTSWRPQRPSFPWRRPLGACSSLERVCGGWWGLSRWG
jgi:hypothetical protein